MGGVAIQKGQKSRGSERLEKLFGPPIITRKKLAEHLHVTKQSIWQWVRGEARPNYDHIAELKRRFGIDPMDWSRPPRGKRRSRLAIVPSVEAAPAPAPAAEPDEPDKPEPAPLAAWGDTW